MRSSRTRVVLLASLAVALLIAVLSPLASASPDGLERVAEDKGFIETAKGPPFEIIADYAFPWVANDDMATVLAGLTGVIIVAAVASVPALGLRAANRRGKVGAKHSEAPNDSGELTDSHVNRSTP